MPKDISFDFYRAMRTNEPAIVWLVFLCIFIFGTEIIWFMNLFGEQFAYLYAITLSFGIVWGIRQIYYYYRNRATFGEYKLWENKLPFALKGWDQFTHSQERFSIYAWRVNCEIKINFKDDYKQYVDEIKSACLAFCTKANKHIYDLNGAPVSGFSRDPRKNWEFSENTLGGSSNIKVVGEIYRFIKDDLASLAMKHDIIESVEIVADGKENTFRPSIKRGRF